MNDPVWAFLLFVTVICIGCWERIMIWWSVDTLVAIFLIGILASVQLLIDIVDHD